MLYLRSRRAPSALVTTALAVAGLALLARHTGGSGGLGLLAVLAGAALAGPGLAGDDIDLDRTAAQPWPLWRSVHIGLAWATVVAMAATPALTGQPLAPVGQLSRDAAGLIGLVALTAATVGAQHAWIPPVTWSLLCLTALPRLWPAGETTISEAIATWMIQPPDTPAATAAAVALGAIGAVAYAARGPRG